MNGTLKIFAGENSVELTNGICAKIGIPPGEIYFHTFPSGEKYSQYKENIRGCDVFIVQSGGYPSNDNLMQLLIMVDAARRASAGRITAVCPMFFYQRQDRKDKPRVPISAKLVANMLVAAGVNRILTMDLHAQQIQGFFDIPVDHLMFRPILIEAMKDKNIEVVVAPDAGGLKKAEDYALHTKTDLAFISKRRKNDTEIEITQFVGDVKDKNVLIIDDLTESAGTIVGAATACKKNGAVNVYAAVTHNCITEIGYSRLKEAINVGDIDGFYTSNTSNGKLPPCSLVHKLSVANLFADGISRINLNQSVTSLFE